MSLILGAMGGLGDAAQQMAAQNQKAWQAQDQATLESNLALQRGEALEQFKTTLATNTANQLREAQAGRINAAAQPILDQGIVARASAARGQQLPAYDPSDTTGPASFHGNASDALAAIQSLPDGPDKQAALAQLKSNVSANTPSGLTLNDLTPQEQQKFAPSEHDKLNAQIAAAVKTGYFATAQELTKIADAGKVSAGWGGVVVDQNDLDANGNPRVIIDNSGGKLQLGQETNAAHVEAARVRGAEAAGIRAKAIADASGSKDPVLQSLGMAANSARVELDRLRGLQAANPPRPGQPDPFAPLIDQAQSVYEGAYQRLVDRQNQHLGNPATSPGGVPTQTLPTPAMPPVTKPVPTLPPGSVQIGTSGGKPVYQTPDGKKFIAQ